MRSFTIFFFFMGIILVKTGFAQRNNSYTWWNPAKNSFPVIEGQGWHSGLAHPYDRLPAKAKAHVRNIVWFLSHESAGLMIRFRSDARDIVVRYGVSGGLAKPHMPSTGVSGVDLYAIGKDGRWKWTAGRYHFGDTIKYHFASLSNQNVREYQLYLPLYNQVKWLEIGVPKGSTMRPLRLRTEKPIVIYGTSIAQGGVASRPGMAWSSILGRRLNMPVINLGFSGNGRLEKPVADLITELNAKIYIVDCLPNMSSFPKDTIAERLVTTVKTLRDKRPKVPILIVEDADANIGSLDLRRDSLFNKVNEVGDSVFSALKASGMGHIYFLTSAAIGLNIESTVDGIHPNDYGMILYADAYEKKIREILSDIR